MKSAARDNRSMLSSADRFAGLCERLVIGMWMAPLVEGAADEELARNERARSMCGSMMVVEKGGGGSERNARVVSVPDVRGSPDKTERRLKSEAKKVIKKLCALPP